MRARVPLLARERSRPMSRTRFAAALLAALLALPAIAQNMNPRGKVEAEIGRATVSIDYGRPGLGGRSLADLLGMLPEDRVWRAGQNQVTTIETSAPVRIGGKTIPAGRYSLYLHIPESGGWQLLVNRHLGVPLREIASQPPPLDLADEPWPMVARYGQIANEEAARIALEETEATGDGDIFEIAVEGGTIRFAWGGAAYQTTLASP
ncbi:MAG: DUF2911 domain-containing protein [Acidobacteria bacterium]|nr:DUF2911 domain-containing protein [Acidobacteriota bacterium]MYE42481.1 DUF2911 domain-containing protein [Acidobacteriota bacterium]